MRKILLFVFLYFLPISGFTAFELITSGSVSARQQALAGADIFGENAACVFANPIGLATQTGKNLYIQYNSLYSLKQLSNMTAAFSTGHYGIGYYRLAYAGIYSEYAVAVARTLKFFKGAVSVGYSAIYYKMSISGLEGEADVKRAGLTLNAGMSVKFFKRISAGLLIYNISGNIFNTPLKPEQRIIEGVAVRLFNGARIFVSIRPLKDINGEKLYIPISYGGEIKIHKLLSFRAGISDNNLSFGIGIKYKRSSFDFTVMHPSQVSGASYEVSTNQSF